MMYAKMSRGAVSGAVSLLLSATLLAACAGPEPRFYSLAAPATAADAANRSDTVQVRSTPLFIDVAPVGVPDRLTRPQLVVRSRDGTRMDVLEQDRWTSPFNNELRDTLASGIAAQLGAVDARRGGRAGTQPVYRIAVDLRQFDAVRGEGVTAAFGWTVTRSDTSAAVSCQSVFLMPATGSDTGALVVAMQQAVAAATAGIVRTVNNLRTDGNTACE